MSNVNLIKLNIPQSSFLNAGFQLRENKEKGEQGIIQYVFRNYIYGISVNPDKQETISLEIEYTYFKKDYESKFELVEVSWVKMFVKANQPIHLKHIKTIRQIKAIINSLQHTRRDMSYVPPVTEFPSLGF
jgi:hypothetical protein